MSNLRFIQAQPFALSGAGASIGDTSITLLSMLNIDGTQITTAMLGDICYGTLEPGNGFQEEAFSFTGVTQNANGTATLTGVKTVGTYYALGSGYVTSSGLAKTHVGGAKVILSNDAGFYNNIKDYLDSTLASGSPLASELQTGIAKLSLAAVTPATPIVVGDNDPRVPTQDENNALAGNGGSPSASNKYVTETGLTNTLATSIYVPIVDTFATSGTWTKRTGIKYISVSITGGGGGGGGATNATGSGGGGSGAYCTRIILASQLGATETVTCGAAGAAGSSGTGGTGGVTSFGSFFSANGGVGGQGNGSNAGGAAGAVSTNSTSVIGTVGADGAGTSGGAGGKSFFATGGTGGSGAGTFGSGGGGANGNVTTGGVGGLGYCLVTNYF